HPKTFNLSNIAVNTGDMLELRISPLSGGLTADFDHSGTVDGLDFTKWKTDFGVSGGSDAHGDGKSDGADFLAWQGQFGSSGGGASASPSFVGVDFTVQATAGFGVIPEPGSLVLGLTALLALANAKRQRSGRIVNACDAFNNV